MKIAVCIKQVPAEYEGVTDLSLGHLIRGGRGRLNPADGPAIEAALRLRELFWEQGGGAAHAFSMGPASAGAVLLEALSMGADAAWLLTGKAFAGADTLATARALAAGMASVDDYGLIVCGLASSDGDTGQVGPALAAILNRPFVGRVKSFTADDNGLILRHKVDDRIQTVRLCPPAVISVTRDFVPRIPGLKARLSKKIFHEIHLGDLAERDEALYGLTGSPTRIKRAYAPERPGAAQVREMSGIEAARAILRELYGK